MRAILATTAALALLSAGGARAATVITLSQAEGSDTGTQTMTLEGDKLRISSDDGDMIYRGDQGKVFIVNADDGTYMEMSPETMKALKARMDQAMARAQQQLATMPEPQRRQMEAAMAQHGMPLPGQKPMGPPQITYQKSGEARTIAKWGCTPYRAFANGKPEADLCVAKLDDLGLTPADMKPLVDMTAFMSKQAEQMGGPGAPMGADFDALKKAVGYDAFPVQSVEPAPMGQGKFTSTLQSIEHKDAPAGTFDLPAGYKRRDLGPPGAPGQD